MEDCDSVCFRIRKTGCLILRMLLVYCQQVVYRLMKARRVEVGANKPQRCLIKRPSSRRAAEFVGNTFSWTNIRQVDLVFNDLAIIFD